MLPSATFMPVCREYVNANENNEHAKTHVLMRSGEKREEVHVYQFKTLHILIEMLATVNGNDLLQNVYGPESPDWCEVKHTQHPARLSHAPQNCVWASKPNS